MTSGLQLAYGMYAYMMIYATELAGTEYTKPLPSG